MDDRLRLAPLEDGEALLARLPRRGGIEYRPAADRRPVAEHDTVAARSHRRGGEPELCMTLADPDETRVVLGRAVVDVHARDPFGDRLELLQQRRRGGS